MSTGRRSRTRRSTGGARPRSYSGRDVAATQGTAAVATATDSLRSVEASDWTEEYSYVAGDLRYLLTVSLSLFILIILAGFIL